MKKIKKEKYPLRYPPKESVGPNKSRKKIKSYPLLYRMKDDTITMLWGRNRTWIVYKKYATKKDRDNALRSLKNDWLYEFKIPKEQE